MNAKELARKIHSGNCKEWEIENFFLEYTTGLREENTELKQKVRSLTALYKKQVQSLIEKENEIKLLRETLKSF